VCKVLWARDVLPDVNQHECTWLHFPASTMTPEEEGASIPFALVIRRWCRKNRPDHFSLNRSEITKADQCRKSTEAHSHPVSDKYLFFSSFQGISHCRHVACTINKPATTNTTNYSVDAISSVVCQFRIYRRHHQHFDHASACASMYSTLLFYHFCPSNAGIVSKQLCT